MSGALITSRHNPRFKELLAARRDRSLMVLEGRRIVLDALNRGLTPLNVVLTPEYLEQHGGPSCPYIVLPPDLFARLTDTETPQGILAVFPVPWSTLEDCRGARRVVILDRLQDPGNVGTIIRTAEAFGFEAVIITPGTASPFAPKALRASMGSCLGLPVARATAEELTPMPWSVVSLCLEGSSPLSRDLLEEPVAVCLGQEAAGVSEQLRAISARCVHIPMQGPTESLNVAQAAAVVLACAAGVI